MKKVYSEILLGDMRACYVQDEDTGSMELVLLPAAMAYEVAYREKPYPEAGRCGRIRPWPRLCLKDRRS